MKVVPRRCRWCSSSSRVLSWSCMSVIIEKSSLSAAAPTDLDVTDLAQLTVPQLKVELRARQLSATGTKPSLLRRLEAALNDEGGAARNEVEDDAGTTTTRA